MSRHCLAPQRLGGRSATGHSLPGPEGDHRWLPGRPELRMGTTRWADVLFLKRPPSSGLEEKSRPAPRCVGPHLPRLSPGQPPPAHLLWLEAPTDDPDWRSVCKALCWAAQRWGDPAGSCPQRAYSLAGAATHTHLQRSQVRGAARSWGGLWGAEDTHSQTWPC